MFNPTFKPIENSLIERVLKKLKEEKEKEIAALNN